MPGLLSVGAGDTQHCPGHYRITAHVTSPTTGEVLSEMHNSGSIDDITTALDTVPGLDKKLKSLKGGRGYVAFGAEYGESIQVEDGRWLTCKVSAEVRLPCHENSDSVATAANLSNGLSQSLAKWALKQAQINVQDEINEGKVSA